MTKQIKTRPDKIKQAIILSLEAEKCMSCGSEHIKALTIIKDKWTTYSVKCLDCGQLHYSNWLNESLRGLICK